MRFFSIIILTAVFSLSNSLSCLAANSSHVGIVKLFAGDVFIERGNSPIRAEVNMKLMNGDQVRTGANGKVGMIFEDDTLISLGSNSKMSIDDFLFQPSEKSFSFVVRIVQGTVSYISGQIAKLAPNFVRIETPHATVGLRGTHVFVKVD